MRVKKTYAFTVDFEQEADGRWSVDIPAVPVCAAWGFTKAEALENLQDLTQGYFDLLLEYGDPLPKGIEKYEIVSENGGVADCEVVPLIIATNSSHGNGLIKTYILDAEVEADDDGRWGADVPYFPGCAAWGYTKAEALSMLQEGAQALLEVMLENGHPVPLEVEKRAVVAESGIVTVTL